MKQEPGNASSPESPGFSRGEEVNPIDYEIALIGGTILNRFRDGDEFADAVEYAMQVYGAPAASVKEVTELARKYARA